MQVEKIEYFILYLVKIGATTNVMKLICCEETLKIATHLREYIADLKKGELLIVATDWAMHNDDKH